MGSGELTPPVRGSGVTSKIRRAVIKGLSYEPSDRHLNMEALLAELAPARRHSGVWLAAAMVAAILIASGTVAVFDRGDLRPFPFACRSINCRMSDSDHLNRSVSTIIKKIPYKILFIRLYGW